MSKFFKNKTGDIEDTFRYAWLFEPYNAENRKFAISVHLLPTRIVGPNFSYKNYPELDKFVKEELIGNYGGIETNSFSGVTFEFSKVDTDETISKRLTQIVNTLDANDIISSGIVSCFRGFPSLTYGQSYFNYTTSADELNILDLVNILSNGCEATINKIQQSIPIVSEQQFDENKSTDTSYVDEFLDKELKKVTDKVDSFIKMTQRINNALEGVEEKIEEINKQIFEPKETYSTEDSNEYSTFQQHWI